MPRLELINVQTESASETIHQSTFEQVLFSKMYANCEQVILNEKFYVRK